jgi:hypothetical protein
MDRGWRSGARLPNGTFTPDDTAGDPADGETVPRCYTCGLPSQAGNGLLDFQLYLRGKRAGAYRLCERCFNRRNAPPLADPLNVPESA